MENDFKLLCNPFEEGISSENPDINREILRLRADSIHNLLRDATSNEGRLKFYSKLNEVKFPNLRRKARWVLAMFCTTYRCEALFSRMNIVKTSLRSRLTDKNLGSLLMIDPSYQPNFKRIFLKSNA